MKISSMARLAVVCAAFALSACGEKPQGMGGVRSDTPPHQGTGVANFTEKDWKAGDKSSWESGLKTRAQYGQNDWSRVN
jgi:hypothetical protein